VKAAVLEGTCQDRSWVKGQVRENPDHSKHSSRARIRWSSSLWFHWREPRTSTDLERVPQGKCLLPCEYRWLLGRK